MEGFSAVRSGKGLQHSLWMLIPLSLWRMSWRIAFKDQWDNEVPCPESRSPVFVSVGLQTDPWWHSIFLLKKSHSKFYESGGERAKRNCSYFLKWPISHVQSHVPICPIPPSAHVFRRKKRVCSNLKWMEALLFSFHQKNDSLLRLFLFKKILKK